jgi:hypothetical protein
MKIALLVLVFLVSGFVYADDLNIKSGPGNFKVTTVSAHNVKGVNVRLWQEITRSDCNRRSIRADIKLVSGTGEGYYDQYFSQASTIMTLMGCPLPKPVTEKVYSADLFVPSFTNENLNGAVEVTFVYPSAYEFEVTEVK